jgi:serine protease Do
MENYVPVRITQMDGIDIGLYDYDRHNAVYYFIVNAEEQIYLRYGGRDEMSPESYLNLESLEKALGQGLELHERYKEGKLPAPPRPDRRLPKDNPVLFEEVTERGRCVECHLIADYDTQHKKEAGTLNAINDLFRSPDIRALGIHLDVPKGLVLERAGGVVAEAGILASDEITSINGTPVYTFGDLQYYYDKVDRKAKEITLTVSRNDTPHEFTVELPREWWFTDLYFRYWSVEPVVFFWSEPLSDKEKSELGLEIEGFASRIVEVDPAAQVYNLHDLKEGDIVVSVDGQTSDPDTQYVERHIQLHKTADERIMLEVLRDGEKIEMKAYSHMQNFRKATR